MVIEAADGENIPYVKHVHGGSSLSVWLLRPYLPVNTSYDVWHVHELDKEDPHTPEIDGDLDYWKSVASRLTGLFQRQASKAMKVIEMTVAEAKVTDTDDLEDISRRLLLVVELLGEPAVAAARVKLSDTHLGRDASKVILSSLANAEDPSTTDLRTRIIVDCATNASRIVKYAAIKVLGGLDTPEAKLALIQIAEHEPSREVRKVAADYLS